MVLEMKGKSKNEPGKSQGVRIYPSDLQRLTALKDKEHPDLKLSPFLRAAGTFYLDAAKEFGIFGAKDNVSKEWEYRPKAGFEKLKHKPPPKEDVKKEKDAS